MKEIYSGEFSHTREEGLKAGNRKFKIIIKDLNDNILAIKEKTIEVVANSTYNVLDVPYLYQRNVPTIGASACASVSSAMVLAYHNKINNSQSSMIETTKKIFSATSSTSQGLLGRDGLANYLQKEYNFSYVEFKEPYYDVLYQIIKEEIDAGRPMILGSRTVTTAGHYMVVIGYNGDNYEDAKLIINDPEGLWLGKVDSYRLGVGKEVEYDLTDITAKPSDGVFILK
jgi:hypothetical protein